MTQLVYNAICWDRPGYLPTETLHRLVREGRARRSWWLGPRLVSVEVGEGRQQIIYKSSDRFKLGDVGDPETVLDALEAVGVQHPSSFADCFHQLAPRSQPIRATWNTLLGAWHGGAWEEARIPGRHPGTWYRYDLRSAYRWAGQQGLPDPATYKVRRTWDWEKPGLWVCQLPRWSEYPPCHRADGWVVASTDELRAYSVEPRVVRYGVTWDRTLWPGWVSSVLDRLPLPAAKAAGRAYWGRWAGRDPLVCQMGAAGKRWELRNVFQHLVWAWTIVSRVRLRLWEARAETAHCYVDEIVTRRELPTGPNPGDWNLKAVYKSGIIVHRTGWWGALKEPAPAMRTGEPKAVSV